MKLTFYVIIVQNKMNTAFFDSLIEDRNLFMETARVETLYQWTHTQSGALITDGFAFLDLIWSHPDVMVEQEKLLEARLMSRVDEYFSSKPEHVRLEVAESIRLRGKRGKQLVLEAACGTQFFFPVLYKKKGDMVTTLQYSS